MNLRLLSKMLGMLLLLLALTMSACLLFSYLDQERHPGMDAVEGFGVSMLISLLAGSIMVLLGWHSGTDLLRKEAIAVVGLGWLVCAVFGALPYILCTPRLGMVDAFFESMSGFTTTGATVIRDLDEVPRAVILWRALTQWLGGLGILVLFVALLSYLGVGSKALFRHESSAKEGGGLQARIHDVAVRLWQIYVMLSLTCCLGLMAMGMTLYDSICHTFTALSTGGFSPYNQSISYFDNIWIELWLVLFMILGGISFMLYAWILRGRRDRWKKEEETKYYLRILAVATVAIGFCIWWYGQEKSFGSALRVSLFQVVSIMTTTGYSTANFDTWPTFAKITLLLLMMIGGCAGSTAGGVKISRWLLFVKTIRIELVAVFRPNQVFTLRLNGNTADPSLKLQTAFFIAIAGLTVVLGTAVVSLLQPSPEWDTLSCVSAVLATLFNIGPGLAQVGPTKNFAELAPATKVFLSLLMALGRLEFFAIMVLFMPSLWRKY